MKWTGLAAIGALIAVQFFSLWWMCIIGVVLCTLVAGLLERENFRLRDELDRYRAVLGRDLGTPESRGPRAGDEFLRGLRQISRQKPSNERTPD